MRIASGKVVEGRVELDAELPEGASVTVLAPEGDETFEADEETEKVLLEVGIDQPKVSALLSGRLTSFSSERLRRLLTRLGQDVEIVVKSKPRRRQRGRIRVVQEASA